MSEWEKRQGKHLKIERVKPGDLHVGDTIRLHTKDGHSRIGKITKFEADEMFQLCNSLEYGIHLDGEERLDEEAQCWTHEYADPHVHPYTFDDAHRLVGNILIVHPYNEPDERAKRVIKYLRQTGWTEETDPADDTSRGNLWWKPKTNGEMLVKTRLEDSDIPDLLSNLAQGNRITVFRTSQTVGIPYQTGMRASSDMERQCIMEWIDDFCRRAYGYQPDIDLPQEADHILELAKLEHSTAIYR